MANVPGAENDEPTDSVMVSNAEAGEQAEATDFANKNWTPPEPAYNGKIINVRLSEGQVDPEELDEQMYKDYLGGYGIGARLLFDRLPAGADPLGPDNVLGLLPGLLTGTPIFGNRFQAVCKSPSMPWWQQDNRTVLSGLISTASRPSSRPMETPTGTSCCAEAAEKQTTAGNTSFKPGTA